MFKYGLVCDHLTMSSLHLVCISLRRSTWSKILLWSYYWRQTTLLGGINERVGSNHPKCSSTTKEKILHRIGASWRRRRVKMHDLWIVQTTTQYSYLSLYPLSYEAYAYEQMNLESWSTTIHWPPSPDMCLDDQPAEANPASPHPSLCLPPPLPQVVCEYGVCKVGTGMECVSMVVYVPW